MDNQGINQLPRGKKEKLEYYRGLTEVNKPEITLSKCEEGILIMFCNS